MILAIAVALIVLGTCGMSVEAQDYVNTYSEVDIYHPSQFLIVTEYKGAYQDRHRSMKSRGEVPIFRRDTSSANTVEIVNHEIDVDSRIRIQFDRKWIFEHAERFEGEITIKGQVKGKTGIRNVEIPGYSTVSEGSAPTSVRIRSANELIGIIAEISLRSDEVDSVLRNAGQADSIRRLQLDLFRKPYYRPDEEFEGIDPADVRKLLLDRKNLISIPLEKLSSLENEYLVKVLNRNLELASQRDAQVISVLAKDILEKWYPILEATNLNTADPDSQLEAKKRSIQAVSNINANLMELKLLGTDVDKLKPRVAGDLVNSMKDVFLLVSETGATSGDEIWITITNGEKNNELNRSLAIRLIVQQFGLVSHVTDSFLFLKRLSVGDVPDSLVAAGGSMPRKVNFEPTAGATLGWTYLARRNEHPFLYWLAPSFGINVSFPKFGSSVTNFVNSTLEDTLSTSSPDPTVAVRNVSITLRH